MGKHAEFRNHWFSKVDWKKVGLERMQYLINGGLKKGDKVLEIGCADGFVVKTLVENGYDAYGFDVDKELIARADKKIKDRVWVGKIEDGLPFDDESFDMVYSEEAIEFAKEQEIGKIFSEVYRVLKFDGIFNFSVVYAGDYWYGIADELVVTVKSLSWWVKKLFEKAFFPLDLYNWHPYDEDLVVSALQSFDKFLDSLSHNRKAVYNKLREDLKRIKIEEGSIDDFKKIAGKSLVKYKISSDEVYVWRLYDKLVEEGAMRFLVFSDKKEIVGVAVLVVFDGGVVYYESSPWVRTPEYRAKQLGRFIDFEVIRWAIEHCYKEVNFKNFLPYKMFFNPEIRFRRPYPSVILHESGREYYKIGKDLKVYEKGKL